MKALILWDIDGTLLAGSTVVRDAYEDALMTCFGLSGRVAEVSAAGMTDLQIVREIMSFHKHAQVDDQDALNLFADRYLTALVAREAALVSTLRVLPGALEVLKALEGAGPVLSLLTGNIEPAARLKLTGARLDRFFDFRIGGFGSDHRDRNALVPITLEKCQSVLGWTPSRVVVIGDTPRDVLCARSGGARVIAVASGDYGLETLSEYNPDALLPGLEPVERAVQTILEQAQIP